MKHATPRRIGLAIAGVALSVAAGAVQAQPMAEAKADYPAITPLPELKIKQEMVELGKYLFFDVRLSGDAALSCATCHAPDKGWGDGMALSKGYPASEYFRNAPSLINAGYRKRFMWDGRLDGSDMGTMVRDMITEAHTMNADGRLVQERVKQVPEYVAMWETAVKKNDDPNGMRIFNVVGEFVKTIQSKNVPFDAYLKGETGAIGSEAKDGYALFTGKANCISCHNGPALSDGKLHKTGVPENPAVWNTPLRAITMLRHYSTSGMPNYMNARTDVGNYAITKDKKDIGKFNTPGLRDLKYTAPYTRITRRGNLSLVLRGLEAARQAGLRVRINTVVQRGVNDGEIGDLVVWCGQMGFDLCLIERMPLGAISAGGDVGYLPLEEIRRRLSSCWTLVDCDHRTNGPAIYQHVAENGIRVGFISPMSGCFCGDCSRIRVTSTGILHTCLDESAGTDLRAPLRNSRGDWPVGLRIDQAVARKQEGHSFHGATIPVAPRRSMNVTGG